MRSRSDLGHTQRLEKHLIDYLTPGQPLTTLSGGERQRLELPTHIAEKSGVYVLDEPTTRLYLADVEQLLSLLDRFLDSRKSVIVVEHLGELGYPGQTPGGQTHTMA